MNRWLLLFSVATMPLLAGCNSMSKSAGNESLTFSQSAALAAMSTAQLEAKRVALATEIRSIERDVEMKAGLPMGVFIDDERGRLSELYREANAIERELIRRSAYSRL